MLSTCSPISTWGGAELVLTDPPYGMARFATDTKDFLVTVGPVLQLAYERLTTPGNMFVFTSTAEVVNVANALAQPLRRLLWLYKPADMTYPLGGWLLKSEAILWFTKGTRLFLHDKRPYHHDVYYHAHVGKEGVEGHPTVKPLAVIMDLMERSGGVTVLDPFMGSGTTLVAAAKLGRQGIGIEIEPRYFDLACRRVEEAVRQGDLFAPTPTPAPQQQGLW